MKTNSNKVAREIKRIYRETDVKMKDVATICQKGCSYCCHQVIPVHIAEELPIVKYINEETIKNSVSIW